MKKFLFCIVYRGVTYCEVKETTEENMSEWIDYFADEGEVERNSFLVDGVEYDVPCCFQIWERRVERRGIVGEVESVVEFVKPAEAEFCVRRVGRDTLVLLFLGRLGRYLFRGSWI